MAFAKIIQQQLHDWIAGNLGDDQPLPTDQQIADRFGLTGVESARSLLADLADSGKITIKGFGADRVITLGKEKASFTPARPTRTVTKPVEPVEDRVEKMRRVLSDKAPVDPPAPPPAPRVTIQNHANRRDAARLTFAPPPPVSPAVVPAFDGASEGAQESPPPAPIPAPHPIVGMEMPRPPVTAAPRRQLNIKIPADIFAELEALADAADMMPGPYASAQFLRLWQERTCLTKAPAPRPVIPGCVTTAAIRDGFPVLDFAHRMMALGLAAYQHEMTPETAA